MVATFAVWLAIGSLLLAVTSQGTSARLSDSVEVGMRMQAASDPSVPPEASAVETPGADVEPGTLVPEAPEGDSQAPEGPTPSSEDSSVVEPDAAGSGSATAPEIDEPAPPPSEAEVDGVTPSDEPLSGSGEASGGAAPGTAAP
jgi:hypothetical protein